MDITKIINSQINLYKIEESKLDKVQYGENQKGEVDRFGGATDIPVQKGQKIHGVVRNYRELEPREEKLVNSYGGETDSASYKPQWRLDDSDSEKGISKHLSNAANFIRDMPTSHKIIAGSALGVSCSSIS